MEKKLAHRNREVLALRKAKQFCTAEMSAIVERVEALFAVVGDEQLDALIAAAETARAERLGLGPVKEYADEPEDDEDDADAEVSPSGARQRGEEDVGVDTDEDTARSFAMDGGAESDDSDGAAVVLEHPRSR